MSFYFYNQNIYWTVLFIINGTYSKYENDSNVMKESFVQTLQVEHFLQRFLIFDIIHGFFDTLCDHVGCSNESGIFMWFDHTQYSP